jgi:hypothetical protein
MYGGHASSRLGVGFGSVSEEFPIWTKVLLGPQQLVPANPISSPC